MEMLIGKEVKELLSIAKDRVINNVPSGTDFKVRDLFVGFLWDQVDSGIRKKLGMYFYVWADSEGASYVSIGPKSTSGQQLYTRI